MSGYIPVTKAQKRHMLDIIGAETESSLFSDIPGDIRLKRDLDIPKPLVEMELYVHMKKLADKNISSEDKACFLGAGVYDHFIPAVVNHVVSRQEFYTSYTPYQAEISQGMLQAIFEYQTMICSLTSMDVSNASMYDGATAMAEAALMAVSAARKKTVLVSKTVNPQYRQVLDTYAKFCNFKVAEIDYTGCGHTDIGRLEELSGDETAAAIIQSPNFFGVVEQMDEAGKVLENQKALLIACVDPISLALLKSPAEYGADIVVGDGQALGNSMSFGGPHFGFLAAREKYMRKMPGRIVGRTQDRDGKPGYVLTIQAREQHIRREKATSNICSNQALNALAASVYLSSMGEEGLRETAGLCVQKSSYMYNRLLELEGFDPLFSGHFFKEFVVKSKREVCKLNKNLAKEGYIGGLHLGKYYPELDDCWLIAVTEKRTRKEIDGFVEVLKNEAYI